MDSPENTGPRTWRDALLAYRDPRVITMIFLGFSAGLPFLLVFSTLSAWLRDAEVSRAAIGFFSWVGITYSIKVIWAPVIDRLPVYFITRRLGRRRSWMLIAMIGIAVGLLGLSSVDPASELRAVEKGGVSNFNYTLSKENEYPTSRSGTAIQSKHEVRAYNYKPVPYVSPMLAKFRATLSV